MRNDICRASYGFSLIELMIVVVVVAILSAIAYPSYTDYVQRSRIAEATSTLSDWRIRMERFFQDNRTYRNGEGTCGAAVPESTSFGYVCADVSQDTFTLQADGLAAAGMAQFQFDLNQDNLRRTLAFPGVSGVQDCWLTRKGSAC